MIDRRFGSVGVCASQARLRRSVNRSPLRKEGNLKDGRSLLGLLGAILVIAIALTGDRFAMADALSVFQLRATRAALLGTAPAEFEITLIGPSQAEVDEQAEADWKRRGKRVGQLTPMEELYVATIIKRTPTVEEIPVEASDSPNIKLLMRKTFGEVTKNPNRKGWENAFDALNAGLNPVETRIQVHNDEHDSTVSYIDIVALILTQATMSYRVANDLSVPIQPKAARFSIVLPFSKKVGTFLMSVPHPGDSRNNKAVIALEAARCAPFITATSVEYDRESLGTYASHEFVRQFRAHSASYRVSVSWEGKSGDSTQYQPIGAGLNSGRELFELTRESNASFYNRMRAEAPNVAEMMARKPEKCFSPAPIPSYTDIDSSTRDIFAEWRRINETDDVAFSRLYDEVTKPRVKLPFAEVLIPGGLFMWSVLLSSIGVGIALSRVLRRSFESGRASVAEVALTSKSAAFLSPMDRFGLRSLERWLRWILVQICAYSPLGVFFATVGYLMVQEHSVYDRTGVMLGGTWDLYVAVPSWDKLIVFIVALLVCTAISVHLSILLAKLLKMHE